MRRIALVIALVAVLIAPAFAQKTDLPDRPAKQVKEVPIVWSGGTDGVISPHATIFATVPEMVEVPTGMSRSVGGWMAGSRA